MARTYALSDIHGHLDKLARLVARYPKYNALVADFIARDPIAATRARIAERLARSEDQDRMSVSPPAHGRAMSGDPF